MSRIQISILGLLLFVAGFLGYSLASFSIGETSMETDGRSTEERVVAYWQAPMDPNYRRDGPGKSPMGMDLIPIYADGGGDASDDGPALRINPAVINNIGVRTEVVIRTDISRNIQTVGSVMMDDERRSDIHVRSEGWIEKLAIETEGEIVAEGDLLFQIYSPNLVAAQSEYLQALRLNHRALIVAGQDRLLALGMTSDQVDKLRSSGTAAHLIDVFATQPGAVMELNVREGMFVRPSDTTMSLADLSEVWVLADVFETEAGWVEPGQSAEMMLPAFPGKTWTGRVEYVYPTVEANTRTVRVRMRFPNTDGRLKPNMYANLSIEAATETGVVVVPEQALIRASSGDRVILALGKGRFRPARVVPGIESGGQVQILEGVTVGERVVTSSQFLIDSEASLDAALLRLTTSDVHGAHQ